MKHFCILALVLLAAACKPAKDDPSSAGNTVVTAPLNMHLHAYIGTEEVEEYGVAYTNTQGRKISLSAAHIFLSDLELIKRDNSTYAIPDTVILTLIGEQVYRLGNVPVGNYKSIRFKAGLPSAINAQVPDGTNGPLNDKKMWFSNTPQADNYIFLHCSGMIDTSAALEGKMAPFIYKIGTNAQLKQVVMPDQNNAIQPNTTGYVHMLIDYAKLFDGVDLTNAANLTITTPADNTSSIASNVADNITRAFKYENQ